MELRILGPLEVLDDDGAPVDVGGARPRTLLIDLALAQGHTVPAEQLLEDVWSGERAPARNNLQVHVSRLRRALGDERIATRAGGYALDLPRDAVDASRFDVLAAAGRAALHSGEPEQAAAALRGALSLWRGAALADFADCPFARPVITRLEESRITAIEDRIDADLMLGHHAELIGELEALAQEHPLRERLWSQLMTALYRSGRQAEALRAYQRARAVLAEELGVDPGPALKELEVAVLAHDAALEFSAPRPTADDRVAVASNLSVPTTALFGRAAEIDATTALVREHRVITIVGPGGVGKTRLAVEVGLRVLPEFADGVYLADLAPVADASGVAAAIAAALGVETERGVGASTNMQERLREFLARRETLLILDNCEHVVDAVAFIVEHLVGACREFRVLTTSREPLMIGGEVLWPLAPLDLDDAEALFSERAHAVAPTFAGSAAPRTIRVICERLDCLPLAIELAAARMRAFTPEDLSARLDDRFQLLTSGSRTSLPRQQTLRAVIDWSYDLLFDDERRAFERVSLFAGNFDISAAEAVCTDGSIRRADVAELLARLVDKSLVAVSTSGRGTAFRLLQTLAQYGREQLERSGAAPEARARHAQYVASQVEIPDAEHGMPEGDWYALMGGLSDDIRVAMDWAVAAGDADIACSIAGGLGWYWNMGGRIDDTWRWIAAALALGEPTVQTRRVRVLAWAGLVGIVHESDRAIELGAEGVARARALGDDATLAVATMLHGSALSDFFHRVEPTAELFDESRRAFEAVGDPWSLAMAALLVGAVALIRADFDTALPLLQDAAERFGALGNAWGRGVALRHVADIAMTRGQYEHAERALQHAIAGLRAVGATGVSSGLTARLAYVYSLEGRIDDAEIWFDEALASGERQRYVPALALAYNLRGIMLRRQTRLDEAEACHRRAIALYVDRDAPGGLSLSLASLGYIAELRGDRADAEAQHRASLDAACEAADRRGQALALEGLAGAAGLGAESATTGRFLGAAAALRRETGGPVVGAERIEIERAERTAGAAANDAFAVGQADPELVIAHVRARERSSSD